jgi:hypothetical protein
MSLFRPYVYKNRPDLLDNAPVKKGFFRFFELYFRKFWRFLTLNLWYFLITLPMLLYVFYTLTGYFADQPEKSGEAMMLNSGLAFIANVFSFVPRFLNVPLLVVSVLVYGPITMGLTYIFRNFAREEHAWMSDLWSRAWSNAKQGLFFGIIDILVLFLCIGGMIGGYAEAGKNVSYALSVIRPVVCGIALVVWLFMRHYTYLMAVTVNLSVFHILKNAWLFIVLGFGRNMLSFAVTLVCMVVTFLLQPLLTIILLPLFFYSLSWFCTVFTCYPVIKKYIIVPALEAQEQTKEEISASNEETDGGEREGPDVSEEKEEE